LDLKTFWFQKKLIGIGTGKFLPIYHLGNFKELGGLLGSFFLIGLGGKFFEVFFSGDSLTQGAFLGNSFLVVKVRKEKGFKV